MVCRHFSMAVAVFIVVAFFPGLFAPYSPDALVGPSFLAPGAQVDLPILIVPENSPVNKLQDLAVPPGADRPTVAVVQGKPTAGSLNEQSQKIDGEIKNQPGGLRLRPVIDRYTTSKSTLQAVVDGTDKAAVVQTTEFKTIKSQFPLCGRPHPWPGEPPPPAVSSWAPTISARTSSAGCCGEPASP